MKTADLTIECEGTEAVFARALLAAAERDGIKLAAEDLPKVATGLWGGRLLSKLAGLHTSVFVGQEWRSHGKHRLYCTLIDPSETTFNLGWVDVKTGELQPSLRGNLSKERARPVEEYLSRVWERWPKRPGAAEKTT